MGEFSAIFVFAPGLGTLCEAAACEWMSKGDIARLFKFRCRDLWRFGLIRYLTFFTSHNRY